MRKLPRVLILWGVPGTGKSTFAKYLVKEHGYVRIDTGAGGAGDNRAARAWRTVLQGTRTPEDFLKIARYNPRPVVMEYGMFANDQGIALIARLRAAGAEVWWFDGDREAAFKAWQAENAKARPTFLNAKWHNVVQVINDNYAALQAFFGDHMVRTIEAGPLHVTSSQTFREMFGDKA